MTAMARLRSALHYCGGEWHFSDKSVVHAADVCEVTDTVELLLEALRFAEVTLQHYGAADTLRIVRAAITKATTSPDPEPSDPVQTEARRLYTESTANHPAIHCNRFPLWEELSQASREEWIARATGAA